MFVLISKLLASKSLASTMLDWLEVVIFGLFLELIRQHLSYQTFGAFNPFFINATFHDHDPSYAWMMAWVTNQPTWKNVRSVEVSTTSSGIDPGPAVIFEDATATNGSRSKMFFLPSLFSHYRIWYKGRLIFFNIRQEQGLHRQKKSFYLNILTMRGQKFLGELLQDAKGSYLETELNKTWIFRPDIQNGVWRCAGTKQKRALESIVLDPGKAEKLVSDAKEFMSSKGWYQHRGIPFRRGYLLHGPPGTGKTSLVAAAAGELDLDIYALSLCSVDLNDSTVNLLSAAIPPRCILLIEDIDAAVPYSTNRDSWNGKKASHSYGSAQAKEESTSRSGVSLAGLLNVLDGIDAPEGRILFATTNKYGELDPALCRAGRMDIHLHFELASNYQAKTLFQRFYTYPFTSADLGITPDNCSPPDLELEKAVDIQLLADKFSDAVPVRACSMASLQNYLLQYKTDPVAASGLENVNAFLVEENANRTRND